MAYRKLPALQQRIVQLFSVIYEPVSRTSFIECFNQAGARDEHGKPFASKTLKPHIDQLLELGILIEEAQPGPQCHPLLAEFATRDTLRAGYFEMLAQTVEKNFLSPGAIPMDRVISRVIPD